MTFDTLHLTLDDFDALIDGQLDIVKLRHLDTCGECRDFVRAERELAARLAALPLFAPSEQFAERVMRAIVPAGASMVPARAGWRARILGSRRSLALAASLTVAVLGSMGASIAWSLSHPDALASAGNWLLSEAGTWLWVGVRGLASNLFEQPWYDRVRSTLGSPERLAIFSGSLSLAYLTGVLTLRRLMTAPASGVTRARA